jgi:hypothetical protein
MLHDKPADHLGKALWCTRQIRFALEVMWAAMDALPDDVQASDDEVRAALRTIDDWLGKTEAGELHNMRIAREYAIIRPASLLDPPPPASMTAITTALGVLRHHGLIITEGGD